MKSLFVIACLILAPAAFCDQGVITGTVIDTSGASIARAHVVLSIEGHPPNLEFDSAPDGQFSFTNVAPGSYRLSITAQGFATKSISVELHSGEQLTLPPTSLSVANLVSNVNVSQTQAEIAEEQVKIAEQQRLVGFVPNYYVTYLPDPQPLNTRQKFELTWKTAFDPASFVIAGIIAGVQQSQNTYRAFGEGAQGYSKRYAASYATFFTGTIVSSAILPTVFKQDPRYLYKGTGTKRSRLLYAISRAFICRGDNRRDEFNYSAIFGGLASGAISNLYYPAKNRDGAALTFENAAIGIGADALGNIFEEFVSRHLTPRKR